LKDRSDGVTATPVTDPPAGRRQCRPVEFLAG
jgi:hypothetical protein